MMFRPLLTIVTLMSVVAMPLTAHAYLTPDDVLYEDDFSARFFEPPPSKRTLSSVVEQQQMRSAQRREAELAALNEPEPEEEETMHGAAPEEESSGSGGGGGGSGDYDELLDALERLQNMQNNAATTTTTRDAEDERLLQRLRDREAQENREAWTQAFGGETLRSGAPLSETGPATVLVTLLIAGAIGETWRRVRKAEKM